MFALKIETVVNRNSEMTTISSVPRETPSLDVVTVCFNAEATIERTLESVRNQRESIDSYIIIDGGSTDSTLSIIDRYQDIVSVLVSERDEGISDAFNKGIRRCTSAFVLLLNADDWLVDGGVARVMRTVRESDDVVCPAMFSYRDGRIIGRFKSRLEKIKKFNSMLHPGALVRRDLYNRLGGYSAEYKIGMDYEFFCRCFVSGCVIRAIDDELVIFQEGGVSRKRFWRNCRESYSIRKKYFNAILPTHEVIALIGRYIGDALEIIGLKGVVYRVLKRPGF